MRLDKLKQEFRKDMRRLSCWFFTKPKTGFWAYAFWMSILFRWVTPTVIVIMVFLQIGLVTPYQDAGAVNATMERAADNLATAYIGIMHKMYVMGQNFSLASPIMGRVIYYALSAFIYVIWAGMITVLLTLLRYFLAWLIKKLPKKKMMVFK